MIPEAEAAVVEERKILDYLLSDEHPEGGPKARFFKSMGFSRDAWPTLQAALKAHAMNPLSVGSTSPFGAKYTVDGPLVCPTGASVQVRTIWIVEYDRPPRLITAHPLPRIQE